MNIKEKISIYFKLKNEKYYLEVYCVDVPFDTTTVNKKELLKFKKKIYDAYKSYAVYGLEVKYDFEQ